MKKNIVFGLLLLCVCFALTGCGCSKKEFTVSFNSNGGSSVSSQSVKDGQSASKPTDPSKDGYSFVGWFLDLDDDDAFDFNSKITKDITLFAKWAQGQSGEPCSKTCKDGYTLDSNKCECVKNDDKDNDSDDDSVAVKSVSVDKTSVSLVAGNKTSIKASINPSNASNKSLKWSSSNSKVATVDQNGNITAVAAGTATITVKAANGKSTTIKVTVSAKNVDVISVSIDGGNRSLKVGDSVALKATINPSNASNKSLTWSSSKSDVASVDKNGKVTARAAGTTTITVKTANGKSASVTITVTATYTIKLTGIVPADGSAIKQYIAAVSDTAGKAVTDYKSFSYNSHTIRNNGEFVRADFVNRSVSTAKLTLADGSIVDVKVSYGDINETEVR